VDICVRDDWTNKATPAFAIDWLMFVYQSILTDCGACLRELYSRAPCSSYCMLQMIPVDAGLWMQSTDCLGVRSNLIFRDMYCLMRCTTTIYFAMIFYIMESTDACNIVSHITCLEDFLRCFISSWRIGRSNSFMNACHKCRMNINLYFMLQTWPFNPGTPKPCMLSTVRILSLMHNVPTTHRLPHCPPDCRYSVTYINRMQDPDPVHICIHWCISKSCCFITIISKNCLDCNQWWQPKNVCRFLIFSFHHNLYLLNIVILKFWKRLWLLCLNL